MKNHTYWGLLSCSVIFSSFKAITESSGVTFSTSPIVSVGAISQGETYLGND